MRTALVVDADESFRLMVTEGLSVFSPGFQVASASDLSGAEGRPEADRNPLVVVRSGTASIEEIEAWAGRHGAEVVIVPRGRVTVLVVPRGFRLAASDRLSDILRAVRDVADDTLLRVRSEEVS